MPPNETHAQPTSFPFATLDTTAFVAFGKTSMENFISAQTEFVAKVQETNKQWFDRMQSEASAASEFGSKLATARSIPDAMSICQEWGTRCLEMIAEDRKHLFSDCQSFAETGTRLLSKGWHLNGSGMST
jgi:Phasin protein